MTTIELDPFAGDDPFAPTGPERDQYGRPKIIQLRRNGTPDPNKTLCYTRASTFAKALDEAGGLTKWKLWHLALALGRNEDLAALAGVFGPTVDDLSRQDKQELDRIIDAAHDRSGGNAKANHGTAVHAMTEPDRDPYVPERMRADVAAYQAALIAHGLTVVDSEQFVVCDKLKVAGTYDHRYLATRDIAFEGGLIVPAGTVMIGDKKTGKNVHFGEHVIQLATYAHGVAYDGRTGERAELEATSHEWGIVAHIPKRPDLEEPARCDLYLVDLTIGWAACQLAETVRKHRKRKDLGRPFPTLGGPTAPPIEAAAPAVEVLINVTPPRALPAEIAAPRALPAEIAAPVEAEIATDASATVQVAEAALVSERLTEVRRAALRADLETTDAKIAADRQAAAIAAEIAADQARRAAWLASQEPAATEVEAVALLADELGAKVIEDEILVKIEATNTAAECAVIWRQYNAYPRTVPWTVPWTEAHSEAVRAKYPDQTKAKAA